MMETKPSVGAQIGEIAGDIRRSAWRTMLGLPEPTPEPTPEPEPTPTDIESLFADFLAQIDEEFTGQIEQVNEIIQNFVETLPDFDAMPTMEDIAEYFEIIDTFIDKYWDAW